MLSSIEVERRKRLEEAERLSQARSTKIGAYFVYKSQSLCTRARSVQRNCTDWL